MLDEKIECSECHRVFFAKSTAGKRVAAPDHTKAYIGFGVVIVAIIGLFAISGSGNSAPPKKKKPTVTMLVEVRAETASSARAPHAQLLKSAGVQEH